MEGVLYIDELIVSFDSYNEVDCDVFRGTKLLSVRPNAERLTNGRLEIQLFAQLPDMRVRFDTPRDILILKLVDNGSHISDEYIFLGTVFVPRQNRPNHVFYKYLEIPTFKESFPSSKKVGIELNP